MELDPNTAATGGGGIIALVAAWFGIRKWNRNDKKENAVDEGWAGIVTTLRAEVTRMDGEIQALALKVAKCEGERDEARQIVAAFERRYGSRKTDIPDSPS